MIHLGTRDMLIVLVALLGVHAQLVPRHVVIAIMAMGGGLVVFACGFIQPDDGTILEGFTGKGEQRVIIQLGLCLSGLII